MKHDKPLKKHHFKPNYSGLSCEYKVAKGVKRGFYQYCCAAKSAPIHFESEKDKTNETR